MSVNRKLLSTLCSLVLCLVVAPQVHAYVDLSGNWLIVYHEDWIEIGTGPDIADFTGLPLNEAAVQRGLMWHPSLINVPERQCEHVGVEYANRWQHSRIWKQIDSKSQRLVAYRMRKQTKAMERYIWMDGRPRPPEGAVHTAEGFSLGEYDGSALKVTTTHIKEGILRRNGVRGSDRRTVVEHFWRFGNQLAVSTITDDPVYLTEPLPISTVYVVSLTNEIPPVPCESVVEIVSILPGQVPHYFPWKNPYASEFAKKYGIPFKISLGGAAQMYPSFIERELPGLTKR